MRMKKLLWWALAVTAFVFVGCSEDGGGQESEQNLSKAIVGSWSWYGYYDSEDDYWEYANPDYYGLMIFHSDGTGFDEWCEVGYHDEDEFTYKIKDRILYVDYNTGYPEDNIRARISITKNEMIMYFGTYGKSIWKRVI